MHHHAASMIQLTPFDEPLREGCVSEAKGPGTALKKLLGLALGAAGVFVVIDVTSRHVMGELVVAAPLFAGAVWLLNSR